MSETKRVSTDEVPCPECKGFHECDECGTTGRVRVMVPRAELEAQIAAVTAQRDRAVESVARLRRDVEHEIMRRDVAESERDEAQAQRDESREALATARADLDALSFLRPLPPHRTGIRCARCGRDGGVDVGDDLPVCSWCDDASSMERERDEARAALATARREGAEASAALATEREHFEGTVRAAWRSINERRTALIDREFEGAITPQELAELEHLQAAAEAVARPSILAALAALPLDALSGHDDAAGAM